MNQASQPTAARGGRYAFPALIAANMFLALGPWMVRLADVGPVAAAFWRLILAAPVLLFFARARGGSLRMPPALAIAIAAGGLFFAADLAVWHIGIGLTKLANATLFANCSSFIFALYGFIVLRQLPRRAQAAALACAAAGSALLLGSSYELSPAHFRGDLLALLAGLFYTFYLVAVDRARQSLKPMPVLALATLAGTAPLLVASLAMGEAVVPHNWTPIVLLSIGSQLIGQGLLVYSMGYLSPVIVGLGLLTQPAVSAMVGWLVYGEKLGVRDLAGAVLICAALVLIRLPGRSEEAKGRQ